MKPKSIGIIGGAGPMAGAVFLERLFSIAGSQYGCFRDADFPEVMVLSFPFSEMLAEERDEAQVKQELSFCLNRLRSQGATILAIACNTLHAFLDEELPGLIQLPRAIAEQIPPGEIPLVLCTSTSRQFGLHKRFFPCVYPSAKDQKQIDQLINQILKGDREKAVVRLSQIIETQSEQTIVLGCTELSLFSRDLSIANKLILDPMEIAASKVLEEAFLYFI